VDSGPFGISVITEINDGVVQDSDKGMKDYRVKYGLSGVGDDPKNNASQKCT
jgi:hypothetical protein